MARLPKILSKNFPASCYVIICDTRTKKLYGIALRQSLHQSGLKAILLSLPEGEKSKTQKFKTLLEEKMLLAKCDRGSLVLALGGGVVGDLAGFIAASYMRGVGYIQLPTTLLSMLDSAIGGKTGINTRQGKNLIGAFWQPKAVMVDLLCLKTLGQEPILDGVAEAAKMFLISDKKSFAFLQKNLPRVLKKDLSLVQQVVRAAVTIKAQAVSTDEREGGARAVLNFGHTIGHALEKISGFKLRHGRAVILGVLAEAKIAHSLGILADKDFKTIRDLAVNLGADLRVFKRIPAKKIAQAARGDKKSAGGQVRYVLIKTIGEVYRRGGSYAHAVPEKIVIKTLRMLSRGL